MRARRVRFATDGRTFRLRLSGGIACFSYTMRNARRTILSTALVLFALVFVGIVLLATRQASGSRKQLADGTVVQLKGALYDRQFRLRTGTRWCDYLGTALPERWAKALDAQYARIGTSNSLTVWLTLDRKQSPAIDFRGATLDAHGCEFGLDPINLYAVDQQVAVVYESKLFPRGDDSFRFRLYQHQPDGSWSAVAEFPVKNPKRQPRMAWKAEPFPITNHVDGVAFTLLDLKSGMVAATLPARPPKSGELEGVAIKWQLPSSQRWTVDWELAEFKGISDAFGQSAGRGSYVSSLQNNGEYLVCVDGGLCVEEPVWKVDAEFVRTRDFPSNELWTIRGIAVPSSNAATLVNLSKNLNGATIQLMGISGLTCPTPKIRRSLSEWPIAHVVCASIRAGTKLNLVRAVDDAGRDANTGWRSADGSDYAFGVKIPNDAKSLDLTFAVTKRVAVTYYVKPSRMTPAELKKLQ